MGRASPRRISLASSIPSSRPSPWAKARDWGLISLGVWYATTKASSRSNRSQAAQNSALHYPSPRPALSWTWGLREHPDRCPHRMLLAWRKSHRRAENIARFHTREAPPLVIAEVAQRRRTLLPRIPHHCRRRVFLLCLKGSMPGRIDQFRCARDIEVGIVRLARKHQVSCLRLLAIPVDIVQIRGPIETAHVNFLCVAHPRIRVQCLFESEGRLSCIRDDQCEPQRSADRKNMIQTKRVWPPPSRRRLALGRADHNQRLSLSLHRLQPPFLRARETVRRRRRIIGLGAKPGKANRNPTADRLALLPMRLFAEEEYLFAACRPPRRDLCPVEIDLRRRRRCRHANLRQPTVAGDHCDYVWNSECAIKSVDACQAAGLVHLNTILSRAPLACGVFLRRSPEELLHIAHRRRHPVRRQAL